MQIPKRKELCIIDQKKWNPNSEYISLIWNDEGQWFREDYCCQCWLTRLNEQNLPKGSYYWKGKIPFKSQQPPKPVFQKAVELFIDLSLHTEEEKLFYVLALFLERKKIILKRQEIKNKPNPYLIYEIPEREEVFSVKVMPLSENEIRVLYEELTVRLGC